ncbi:MAG: CBS domain-containing protein [Rhodobacteraceae bacterium]|nr:CBS domain-containing protein [Paracoccaceae bacterium]
MPESYRPHLRKDDEDERTVTQSIDTNVSTKHATVQNILDRKGGTVFSIRPQDTLHKAVEILRDQRIGALVVTDATGALQGILSERDIVRKLADAPGRTLPHKVEDIMTRDVVVATPDEPLVTVLQRMTKGRFRHMPVVASNELVGMITIGDVVQYRLNELEHEALQIKQLIVG